MTTSDKTWFGSRVRQRREALGLTRKELAYRVGCALETIRKIESGDRHASIQIAELLTKELDLDAEQRSTLVESARPKTPISNLAPSLTSVVGREKDIASLKERLQTSHLVTLTGTGGVGKSRLAQQVAAEVQDRFADGVWLIQLAPINFPVLVADAVASTLGVRPTSRMARDVLIDFLRGKHLLLVLDNCEHLVQACAELVQAMLQACPHLHILATSRELLNISGEMTWHVPSLAAETAMQLFVERARAARPNFKLDESNAGSIVRICERLDGIPLAIELAAARSQALSVEHIATRLHDRFQLLMDGNGSALPRHQTLRALIDWSYDLLTAHERTLLRQVSVFAGGWTLAAAETVADVASTAPGMQSFNTHDTLDLLTKMVNKSLVTLSDTPLGARYSLHETIRQYAHEKLMDAGEEELTRQRHLDFFASMAEEAKPHMRRGGQACKGWLDRIQADNDNFRAALARVAQMQDVALSERLIDALCFFWTLRFQPTEGIYWIDRTLICTSCPGEHAYAVGRTRAGFLSFLGGRHVQATAWLEEALPLVRALNNREPDRELMMHVTRAFGFMSQGYEQSIQLVQEAIWLAEELGWVEETVVCLFMLGRRMHVHGDRDGATRALMEGVRLASECQMVDLAYCLSELGVIAFERDDCVQARALLEQSILVGCEWGDPNIVALSQLMLAEVALRQRLGEEAMRLIKESIMPFLNAGNLDRVAHCLSVAAGVAQTQGEFILAVRWLSVADVVRHDFSGHTWLKQWIYAGYERRLMALREVVAPADFDRAWAEGARMTLAQVVDDVLAME